MNWPVAAEPVTTGWGILVTAGKAAAGNWNGTSAELTGPVDDEDVHQIFVDRGLERLAFIDARGDRARAEKFR